MFSGLTIIYAGAALSAVMIAEAAYLLYAGRADRRTAINRRMKLQDGRLSQEQVLVQLRKERGVEDARLLSFDGLRRLRTQSGLAMPLPRLVMTTAGVALGIGLAAISFGLPLIVGLGIAVGLAGALPFMVLRFMRNRRHKLFGIQLPESLELITRSLKAGHPVPVAISMVAREMSDPIGTEFGMVADEVTYGSDLVTALQNMFQRVGHEDLPLFVTAVSIQTQSGGNLREILDGLSQVIRDRGKLKRKVRSISTEGRMSAYILTAVPILLACAMQVLAPQMYGEVMDEPMTWYLLGGTIFWLVLGNLIMFKMSNFKF